MRGRFCRNDDFSFVTPWDEKQSGGRRRDGYVAGDRERRGMKPTAADRESDSRKAGRRPTVARGEIDAVESNLEIRRTYFEAAHARDKARALEAKRARWRKSGKKSYPPSEVARKLVETYGLPPREESRVVRNADQRLLRCRRGKRVESQVPSASSGSSRSSAKRS